MIYEAEIARAEESLRAAMLTGDVTALSALIDDRLVFTGADGTVVNKDQDLSAHASGVLKLAGIELTDEQFHPIGDMVLATTKATLAGTFGDMTIDGTYAYTRLWSCASGQWRVIAGQAARIG
jgi:ketosteroid isomerase-like protein